MKQHSLSIRRYLLPALIPLLLCSCGRDPVDKSPAGQPGGGVPQILHLGNGAEPKALDPHVVTGVTEHNIISALLEGLVTEDPKTLEPQPGAAES